MDTVKILPAGSLGLQFIPPEYLPPDADEYYLRNRQFAHANRSWRRLTDDERETLVGNGNRADSWDDLLVGEAFDPAQIRHSSFHGLVRIGAVENLVLEHHDLRQAVGITNSRIISCDIGDYVAVHDVQYMAHYVIGDRSIIAAVGEMHTTDHAKFGNGIVKDGEPESIRITLSLINEAGSRSVCPFDGMLPADAYLWARYRDDEALMRALKELTAARCDSRRGYYGTVGEQTVIKSCRIIKDVKVGDHCYIKGANKLKNITINSSAREQTQIGEGVELVNGIVESGSRVFYGSKAVRFILGRNCELKYGARLIHAFLGDNSTVSCCELLNNLIFPAHEQHHNNSFLIASLVMGQSNIAAGATIGSNHNSRSNDSEIQAGRGFWPGLNTSLKHSSRFASFVLIASGSYPSELDIRLPFSLVSNNVARERLEVIPAFWWLHNMYALARNDWKFRARDTRSEKLQHIEFDTLAPDTIEEILLARQLLEIWTGEAAEADRAQESNGLRRDPSSRSMREFAHVGRKVLNGRAEDVDRLTVLARDMEKSRRNCMVLKTRAGYEAYGQMLHIYAARNLIAYLTEHAGESYDRMSEALAGERTTAWVNLGGQLVPEADVDALRREIGGGAVSSWSGVHERYEQLWHRYETDKQRHAFAVFADLVGSDSPDLSQWRAFAEQSVEIQQIVRDRVRESRAKDDANPFRRTTYRNDEEMAAALGSADDNSFVIQVRLDTDSYERQVEAIIARG